MGDDFEHSLLDAAKGETPVHSNTVGDREKSLDARIWALAMPSHF